MKKKEKRFIKEHPELALGVLFFDIFSVIYRRYFVIIRSF
ncbi:hypothetical protein EH5_00547 [Bacillus subtilis]|nr:hypothetical protein EH5_00547 [Bacillus subtilis]